jgi:DNA-binding CsgD family transcriptional regulator/tetratricopeptide (TPR) repeat protein
LAGRGDEARHLGEAFLDGGSLSAALRAEIENGMRTAWAMRTTAPYPRPLPVELLDDAEVPPALRASLLVLAQASDSWYEPGETVERAFSRAAELYAASDETGTVTLIPVRTAFLQERGRMTEAVELAEAHLHEAEPASPTGAGRIESALGVSLMAAGRPVEAKKVFETALRDAKAVGSSWIYASCHSYVAAVLLELGRVEDALVEASIAAEACEELGFSAFLDQALAVQAEACFRQGNLKEASSTTKRLTELGLVDLPACESSWIQALSSDAHGGPAAALEALHPILRRLEDHRYLSVTHHPSRLPQIVDIALRAKHDAAAEVAVRAADLLAAQNPGLPSVVATAVQVRGQQESDPGALRDAVSLLTSGERPLATAFAREHLGCALRDHARRDEAVAALEAAHTTYTSANAYRDVARVRSILHGLGVRKPQATIARPERGWESLTRAEIVVARIVAEGRTNREAASELFVSPETVNTHLRHIFTKLSIRSRVELTRFVLDREAAQPVGHLD